MPFLVLTRNGAEVMRFPMTQERILVGRDPECDVPLSDPTISRHHFELLWDGTTFHLTDHSRNGTFVNGERVTDTTSIDPDQEIELGDYRVHFSKDTTLSRAETVGRTYRPTLIIKYEPKKKELTIERIALTVTPAEGAPRQYTLDYLPITFGASRHCAIAASDDPYVSRTHCIIEAAPEGLILRDCQSRNGTWWQGTRCDRMLLPERGRFQMGETVIEYHVQLTREAVAPAPQQQCGELLGRSRAMKEIFSLVARVAPSDATAFIAGESGTGKELLARALHAGSGRATQAFVALNCGAIPATIIESELFGHERGAFTGASARHEGVFEQADGGTLFLDEIGEMPIDLQTRLLRVLETKTVRRIGGTNDIAVDCRILAATHQDLATLVHKGAFREDLFYRLYIVPMEIPPLRTRPEDIDLLASHFLQCLAPTGRELHFSSEAMRALCAHSWPGNVRELRHTIERAILHTEGAIIQPQQLHFAPQPQHAGAFGPDIASPHHLRVQERRTVEETLKVYRGNVSRASKALGISRSTLLSRVKEWGIDLKPLRA